MQIKMKNKNRKGVLGEAVTLFFATVIIVIILLGFVLVSSMIKIFSDNSAGTVIAREGEVGLQNPSKDSGYFWQFNTFVMAKAAYNATSGNIYEIMKAAGRQ